MKLESLRKSELIKKIGYDSATRQMEIVYRADGARFVYSGISPGLFAALKRSANPGETWVHPQLSSLLKLISA